MRVVGLSFGTYKHTTPRQLQRRPWQPSAHVHIQAATAPYHSGTWRGAESEAPQGLVGMPRSDIPGWHSKQFGNRSWLDVTLC